ncbi:MAG: DUF1844 domain-containing protein [Sedimentisphaerales bacterium]|nr:DUF1844 domain-containing protein [Sedimentisphaerales bacterium]
MADEKEEKKIIVDEDWKAKAQKEKEELKEKESVEKQQAAEPLPTGNFSALISMLATQALFAMGLITLEKDKQPQKDLRLAKFQIDMIEMLEEKTKGNLTDQETNLLTDTLGQLRMAFVEASK